MINTRWMVVLMTLALTGCAPQGSMGGGVAGEARAAAPAEQGYEGQWQLKSGRAPSGRIPKRGSITLDVAGRRFSGRAACNSYDATAKINGAALRVKELMWTQMGCMDRKIMRAEERYLNALQSADTIAREGDRLRISGDGVDLRFVAVVPPAPATFEDTAWHLDTLGYGRGPESTVSSTYAPADLTFSSDGTLAGATGCRDLTGRWQRDGDTVTVTGLPSDDVDCAVGEQDDHLMTVLRTPFTAEVDGRRLWLQQADGDLGLGYTADEP